MEKNVTLDKNIGLAFLTIIVVFAVVTVPAAALSARTGDSTPNPVNNDCANGANGHAAMHGDDWEAHERQMHGEDWQSHMGQNMMGGSRTSGTCH